MHSEEEQTKILEAARDATQSVMRVGAEAGVCPHCFIIMSMAFMAKCLTDPNQESTMKLDYVIYAMLSDYYAIEDARDKHDDLKNVSRMH